MNDAFDRLNSVSKHALGPKRCILKSSLAESMSEMQSDLEWIGTWTFHKGDLVKDSMPCKEGLVVSVQSVMGLTQTLILEEGYEWVMTRRFTQDHLEVS